jgi:hypothetical protein
MVNNSWGVYDYFKYYRRTKPKGTKWVLTDVQYYAIFRRVNELLVENLLNTGLIEFPHRMGELTISKKKRPTYVDANGNTRIQRQIDWNSTFELWYDDAEAYRKKTFIYYENEDRTRVRYLKRKAVYKNKFYYDFKANRDITRRLLKGSVVSYIISRDLQNQIKGLYDG